MYLAKTHSNGAKRYPAPDLAALERFIDRDSDHPHWIWTGEDFFMKPWLGPGHPRIPEEAMFRLKVGLRACVDFSVIRLLLQHNNVVIPAGRVVMNTCGLSTCVNPEHWRVDLSPALKRNHGASRGASPLPRLRPKKRLPRGNRDDVHCVDWDRPGLTGCGRPLDGTHKSGLERLRRIPAAVACRSAITCAACIRAAERNPQWPFSE